MGILIENRRAGEVLGRRSPIIHLATHHLPEAFDVFRARPLERGNLRRHRDRSERVAGSPRLGQEESGGFQAVTHHIVEDATALFLPLPEPGAVRPAVFFRRSRQVRTARERRAPTPEDLLPSLNRRSEDLILQIPVQQTCLLDTCD